MAEPKRAESSPLTEATNRDGRAEALLVEGLDRYFGGRYDEAIHLWTRVLFLDWSHARARAYIDRARTALAEQQRRTEEMLHASGELIAQGHTDEARDLLTQALAAQGDEARAAALGWRLEHVERARAADAVPRRAAAAVADAVPVPRSRRSRALTWAGVAMSLLLVAAIVRPGVRESLGLSTREPELPDARQVISRPVLSSADVALVRARTLYARGRLAEALQALDRVNSQSTNRSGADQLRVEIQRRLLQIGRGTALDAGPTTVSQP